MHTRNPRPGSPEPSSTTFDDGRGQAWIQPFRPLVLIATIAMLMIAFIAIHLAIEGFIRGATNTSVAFSAGTAMAMLGAVYGLQEAGFRRVGLPRGVRRQHDPVHGYGMRIPATRVLTPLCAAVLVGCAFYTGAASLSWFLGMEESLLPSGRNTDGGATFMALCSVGSTMIALLLVAIRIDTAATIYQDGVERTSLRQFFCFARRYRTFLTWDQIEHISADSLAHHPVIKLCIASELPRSQRTPHDTEHEVTVLAYVLVTEPNTLFALLKRLHANPDDRALVSEADAAELLRPPTLRQRFRAARDQKAKA